MSIGIYKITDKRNGKIYVGQSVDLAAREWKHFCYTKVNNYSKSTLEAEKNMKIHLAMMESCNKNDFSFEVIEYCSKEELDEKEQYYINIYNSLFPNGYNETKGGSGAFARKSGEEHYHHKISKEDVDIIKEKLKNGYNVKEIQKSIPNATLGMISSINNGYSWKDENITYPISKLNGVKKISDEEVIEIRKERLDGESVKNISEKHNLSSSTISSITTGKIRKDIDGPITPPRQRNIFSQEEVEKYRKIYAENNITIKKLWENFIDDTKKDVLYDNFKAMISGKTYKDFNIYEKKNKDEIILQLNQEGLTKKKIGEIVGCSERTVYRIIKKYEK